MSRALFVMETSARVVTGAGMLALWDVARYRSIVDYDSWELELSGERELHRHIRAGGLVPINIGADGAWQVLVRAGRPGERVRLTEREASFVFATSEPYLLVTTGRVALSGLEHIDAAGAGEEIELLVPPGRYAVTLHLIDWAAEPGSRDRNGRPASHALPDFVALINPEQGEPGRYRTRAVSFDPPS
ncbi:hypothetical protein FNH05_17890 [Amycolatopsis rhizosphaerae]|uniref:Uncharacterized protein n=1 Tax=Amycolatopsis rhizosphaerae TaxID=2053003 RepID=A0A558CI17_9PSEU|nr:hypothetical protein [Amycolatopsis rhizosphaerae]TVT48416.1 hypothetical protein FNH05_17890 [Amycolatopsis rhizosphaerae]